MEKKRGRGRPKKLKVEVVPVIPEVVNVNHTEQVVPVDLTNDEYNTTLLLKTAYENKVLSNIELAEKAGLPLELVEKLTEKSCIPFVKYSQFKESYAASLMVNVRELQTKITLALKDTKINSFDIKNLTTSLKTLNDIWEKERSRSGELVSSQTNLSMEQIVEASYTVKIRTLKQATAM